MESHPAVLYDYWRSTASYRVRIALNIAGIPYETHTVDLLKGAQTDAKYLELNPQGFVPVLEIDGLQLAQSLAIIEYLNETRKLGLLPDTAAERAKNRAFAHVVAMDIHPVCNLNVVKKAALNAADSTVARQEWMQHFIRKGLVALEVLALGNRSAGQFFHGNDISLADICLIPQLYNARRWDVKYEDLAKVRAIEDMCLQKEPFQKAFPKA